jgi:hypothetical protein
MAAKVAVHEHWKEMILTEYSPEGGRKKSQKRSIPLLRERQWMWPRVPRRTISPRFEKRRQIHPVVFCAAVAELFGTISTRRQLSMDL